MEFTVGPSAKASGSFGTRMGASADGLISSDKLGGSAEVSVVNESPAWSDLRSDVTSSASCPEKGTTFA